MPSVCLAPPDTGSREWSVVLTDPLLMAEWHYRVTERIGILCGESCPTPEQLRMAHEEADAVIAAYMKGRGR